MKLRTLFAILTAAAGIAPAARADSPAWIRPPYLSPGDTVGLVAPAGKLPEETDTAKIRRRFADWGLNVRFAPHCFAPDQPYFAGTDDERAADLQQMIDDPSVKAVIACRGGYGSVRLLPLLHLERLRERPKWIAGFSDITTLHLALAQLGIESIHGAMPSSFLFDEDDPSAESLREALFGRTTCIEAAPHPLNRHGSAGGRLTGGNLSLLCAAAGTPERLRTDIPTVLFIEDTGEFAFRIDRMMQQLARSGALRNVVAVVAGHFSPLPSKDKFGVADSYEVIAPYLHSLGVPVIFGLPAGHEEPNLALYLGSEVTVTVGDEVARIVFHTDESPKN